MRRPAGGGTGHTSLTAVVLAEDTEAIASAWEARVRERIELLRGAPRAIVLDHVLDVLQALGRWVDGDRDPRSLEVLGASHGIQRVSHGVRMRDLVHEHRLLRDVVVSAASARGAAPADGASPGDAELAQLHEALDVFTTAALERYAATRADPRRAIVDRLRLAITASGLGAWDYDPVLHGFELDERARELLGLGTEERGYPRDEVVGRIHPSDREAFETLLALTEPSADAEGVPLRVQPARPTEPERWVELSAWPLRDGCGAPVRVFGTVLDVTEHRQLEQTRDRFLAVLGHDLRSPLNAIAMAAHLLQKETQPPQTVLIGGRLANSVRRMEALIRDLLDFARAAVGTPLPVAPTPTDIDEVCRKVLDEVRAAHPGATIAYVPDGAPDGVWDPARLEQVLANLLNNAIKYGRRGAPVTLRWSRDAVDRALLVAVHNEGDPIPRELLPFVFDAFRSGRDRSGGAPTGVGVGLYVVAQIVRAHGGDVRIESTIDEGTTFRVRLPLASTTP
jgi:PAS domain-containing protein